MLKYPKRSLLPIYSLFANLLVPHHCLLIFHLFLKNVYNRKKPLYADKGLGCGAFNM